MRLFELGEGLDIDGATVPAFGFKHEGTFIVNARASSCGRFREFPATYGLTEAEADRLDELNRDRDLMAYWGDIL